MAFLSPLPKAENTQKRKRKGLKSEVITSSPFKDDLEAKQKLDEEKRNKTKKNVFRSKSKVHTRSLSPDVNIAGPSGFCHSPKTKTPTDDSIDYLCPLCGDKYVDPPVEEWIQCVKCEKWWHEQCTSYEAGIFFCDDCV